MVSTCLSPAERAKEGVQRRDHLRLPRNQPLTAGHRRTTVSDQKYPSHFDDRRTYKIL
jgi:hypothetical protein